MNFLMHGYWRQGAMAVTMSMRMAMAIFGMVMMSSAAIGPCFRFKLRTFFHHDCPQAFQHLLQYPILVNAQKPVAYLGLGMTVAKVERTAQQIVGRAAGNPVGRLFGRDNTDHSAIIALKKIPIAQDSAPGSKNPDFFPGGKPGSQAAVFAQFIWQNKLRGNLIRVPYFRIQGKHA